MKTFDNDDDLLAPKSSHNISVTTECRYLKQRRPYYYDFGQYKHLLIQQVKSWNKPPCSTEALLGYVSICSEIKCYSSANRFLTNNRCVLNYLRKYDLKIGGLLR